MALTWNELANYQTHASKILLNSISMNRLSHSYVFEGPKGTRRFDTAKLFAQTLLCKHRIDGLQPCQVCHDCVRIEHETHPNVFFVRRDGEKIKKKQMKDLIDEFAKSSVEDGPRIYVIDEADRLNPESANTMLKTMEEPGSDIYQVLVTDSVQSLLTTIVSRSQLIHFRPIDKRLIRQDLLGKDIDPLLAHAIPEYTNNYDEAETLAKKEELVKLLLFVDSVFQKLKEKKESVILFSRSLSESVFKDSQTYDFLLSMMILYQKDILSTKMRLLQQVVLDMRKEVFESLGERMTLEWISSRLDEMLALKQRIKYNINGQFAFDQLLLGLERGYYDGISSRPDSI